MLIIVANDPRLYRMSLCATFRRLRPHVQVVAVEPEHLDREVACLDPSLVICSTLSESIETRSRAWVLLYPDGESRAVISLEGERTTATDVELDDLLSLIDRVELLTRPV